LRNLKVAVLSKNDIKIEPHTPLFETGRDRARFKWSSAFGGIEMMDACFVNHAFTPHIHDELMFGVVHQGVKRFQRERKTHYVTRHGLSINNAGDLHTGERAEGEFIEYSSLYLTAGALAEAGLPSGFYFAEAVIKDGDVWKLLRAAIASPSDTLLVEQSISQALCLAAMRYGGDERLNRLRKKQTGTISTAVEFLHEHLDKDMKLTELAALAGLSVRQFIRSFKHHKGVTPHRYLINIRIQRARELIRFDQSLASLALEVGFADQAHFSKTFKAVMGISPQRYRSAFH